MLFTPSDKSLSSAIVLSTNALLVPVIRIHVQYLTKSYHSGKLKEKDWLD